MRAGISRAMILEKMLLMKLSYLSPGGDASPFAFLADRHERYGRDAAGVHFLAQAGPCGEGGVLLDETARVGAGEGEQVEIGVETGKMEGRQTALFRAEDI